MVSIKKKLGQASQWVGERVGSTKRSEKSREIEELNRIISGRKDALLSVSEELYGYIKALNKEKIVENGLLVPVIGSQKATPIMGLAGAFLVYSAILPQQSRYGKTLKVYGECLKKIGAIHKEYFTLVEEGYLNMIDSSLEIVKRFDKTKKRAELRRLYYDSRLNKIQKSKKENAELEEDLRVSQAKYEESKELMNDLVKELISNEKEEIISLLDFFKVQIKMHKNCIQAMCDVSSQITSIIEKEDDPPEKEPPGDYEHSETETKESQTDLPVKSTPNTELFEVVAKYDFQSDQGGDLSFKKGDYIQVTNKTDESWWEGKVKGGDNSTGIFPINYCTTLDGQPLEDKKHESPPSSNNKDSLEAGSKHVHTKCPTCDCSEFLEHQFRTDTCSNCYHQH